MSPTANAVREARDNGEVLLDEAYAALRAASSCVAAVMAATGTPVGTVNGLHRLWAEHNVRGVLKAWQAGNRARLADRGAGATLRQWIEAVTALEPLDRSGLSMAQEAILSGEVPASGAVAALDRGLAGAALEERLGTRAMAGFDGEAHDRIVDRFVGASDALRGTLRGILPSRVVQERPFKPGATFGTVAALEREVGRTRGGLSVRRLVQTYGEVIGELTPCVLVSPDSLARFIPPGSIDFDLVVFDEASQITVPDAIGALGRARAAVIAGDSKQMPPSSFGEVGWDDSAESDRDLPVASVAPVTAVAADPSAADGGRARGDGCRLPDRARRGVDPLGDGPRRRRPAVAVVALPQPGRVAHRVLERSLLRQPAQLFPGLSGRGHRHGVVVHPGRRHLLSHLVARRSGGPGGASPGGPLRTNPVEAAAVVEEVRRRWGQGERSIGVVTFNLQQRTLIEKLLWDLGDETIADSLASGKDGLFVKNLENVQGDERDVIIFSTGFAKTASGVLPLNFGPLNRTGASGASTSPSPARAVGSWCSVPSSPKTCGSSRPRRSASNTCAPISRWPNMASDTRPRAEAGSSALPPASSATATAQLPADASTPSTGIRTTSPPPCGPRACP
ncbi:MAG: hypothetical protein IPF40_08100 [Actinomycetales bacterium]|uniref:DNA2/NAM7 helicase-like C-terminal domain-containing protein n=1 Tax=Candidatus Phosphoribacter hodrii TaxID=2953743 RepID=A0A934X568_9MICO|nr:hypothetical protein [Candidatus Phosphoribacter hodrii]